MGATEGKRSAAAIYKRRTRSDGTVEETWYAVGPERANMAEAELDLIHLTQREASTIDWDAAARDLHLCPLDLEQFVRQVLENRQLALGARAVAAKAEKAGEGAVIDAGWVMRALRGEV